MAATPPPPSPSDLQAPRAPRRGALYDDWEPYPTRYSTRLASQRAAKEAQSRPPPSYSSTPAKSARSKRTLSLSYPDTHKSPPKKAAHTHASSSRLSPFDSAPPHPRTSARQSSRSSAERALPTPVKTPAKKQAIISTSGSATPRALFPPNSTSKRRKMDTNRTFEVFSDQPSEKASGSKLGTSVGIPGHVDVHGSNVSIGSTPNECYGPKPPASGIAIHTDSRDRIPMVADEKDNPFYVAPTIWDETNSAPHDGLIPVKTGVKHSHTVNGNLEKKRWLMESKAVDDENPNGAWFMSRGTPVYKRFDDMDDSDEEDDLGLFANRPDLLARNPDCLKGIKPLKRSEIKPKCLFPVPRGPGESMSLEDLPSIIRDPITKKALPTSVDPFVNNEEDVTDVEDNEAVSPSPQGGTWDSDSPLGLGSVYDGRDLPSASNPSLGVTPTTDGSFYNGRDLPSASNPSLGVTPITRGSFYDGRDLPSASNPSLGVTPTPEDSPYDGRDLPSASNPSLGVTPTPEDSPYDGRDLPSASNPSLGVTPAIDDPFADPSISSGTLHAWLKSSKKANDRAKETAAERIKRHRETRGSPHPRTRMGKQAEAAAAASAQAPVRASTRSSTLRASAQPPTGPSTP